MLRRSKRSYLLLGILLDARRLFGNQVTISVYVRKGNPVIIPRRYRLGCVSELTYSDCFQIQSADLAMKPPAKKNWVKQAFAATAMFSSLTQSKDRPVPTVPPDPDLSSLETALPNGIMVYGSEPTVQAYTDLVNDFRHGRIYRSEIPFPNN